MRDLGTQLTHDNVGGQARLAPFVEGGQANVQGAGIGAVAQIHERQALKFLDDADTWSLPNQFGHALTNSRRTLQRGAVGKLHVTENVAFILRRNEAAGHFTEPQPGQADQTHIQQQANAAMAEDDVAQCRDVAPPAGFEHVVKTLKQPAHGIVNQLANEILFLMVRFQQQRGQRRAERQRIECRDQCGDRHGQRELLIELARDAGDEGGGNEHRAQHESDRNHRPADLVHRLVGRLHRGQAFRKMAFDVLHNDDRVVHHDADGQHQAEQGQVVQGEAHCGHGRERADERDRDRHQRDDGSPPILQKQYHHDHHQEYCLNERLDDSADGLADERRGVKDSAVVQPFWELFLEFLHRIANGVGGLDRIGAGLLEDGDGGRRPTVHQAVDVVIVGAQFDARHVPQPGNLPGGIGL